MKRDKLRFLRNIGIAAHIDAGKTTLTERVLYFTGKSHKLGETHLGNSQMDTSKQEIEKGITISSAATHTEWTYENKPYSFNIIDTPGHVDFMIEVERSLRVLDGMVALFDAVAGVESQTETVWQQATRYNVPVIGMVNKMDRTGADFFEVVAQMRARLGANALPIQIPIGEEDGFEGVVDLLSLKAVYWNKDGEMSIEDEIPNNLFALVEKHRAALIEAIVELDEDLFEQYLEGPETLTLEELMTTLRKGVLTRNIVPVLMGAAYKNKGVQTLLNAVCAYLPSPLDRGAVEGTSLETEESVLRQPATEEPFSALAFKIALDEQNRQLCFFRVYSGTLKVGDAVLNPRTGKKERIGRLYQMHANKREEITQVEAGDIAATVGLKSVRTGDTLCASTKAVVLESLYVPPPVISMAVEPKRSDQLDKLGLALSKLQMEDPSFVVQRDLRTNQTIMLGMGELHLEIIVDKLKEDFEIEVNVGAPKVAYKEVFTKTTRLKHRLVKQTGGSGLWAEIDVMIGPADASFLASDAHQQNGERLQFVNKIVGGKIPKEFIPSVAAGFKKMLDNGALASYPIQSLKIELVDGNTKGVDSKPLAFELCAVEAFQKSAMQMEPKLMEPIFAVEVRTPDEYLGKILSGLNRRRGLIQSQEMVHQQIQLEARVPLAELFGYINHLRMVSAGRATYSMKFDCYELVPQQLAEQVIGEVV